MVKLLFFLLSRRLLKAYPIIHACDIGMFVYFQFFVFRRTSEQVTLHAQIALAVYLHHRDNPTRLVRLIRQIPHHALRHRHYCYPEN